MGIHWSTAFGLLLCTVVMSYASETVESLVPIQLDCTNIPTSFCIGEHILTGDTEIPGIVGRWTFDYSVGADSSGNSNHMALTGHTTGPGVGRGGSDYSAKFDGKSHSIIAHSSDFVSQDFTATFWVFISSQSSIPFRTLLHKGGQFAPELSILVWPGSGQLRIRSTVTEGTELRLDSRASVGVGGWTHIAVSKLGKLLQLYVNGLLDNQIVGDSQLITTEDPLYIGKDPWHAGIVGFIDDLRLYTRPLTVAELSTIQGTSLGDFPARMLDYGCQQCTFNDAKLSCRERYHLCNSVELTGGVMAAAVRMGWLHPDAGTEIWNYNTQMIGLSDKALGLCCSSY